jgi:hypothetical protein
MKRKKSDDTFAETHLNGRVFLNILELKKNRRKMGLSQMGFADYSSSIREPVSVASIKRAELGHPVIYRTALRFSKLFNVPVKELISNFENETKEGNEADVIQITTDLNMVGRQGEFQYVNYLIQEVQKNGIGKVIWIRGEAGIGKTKFIEILKQKSQIKSLKNFDTQFEMGDARDEKKAVKRILWHAMAILEKDLHNISTGMVKNRLKQMKCQDDTYLYISQFLELELMTKDREIFNQQSHAAKKINLRKAMLDVLTAYNNKECTVWVVENTHYAKEPILDLLWDLVQDSRNLPIVWLMTTRSEVDHLKTKIATNAAGIRQHVIEISPLSEDESRALVQQIRPEHSDLDGSHIKSCCGNPLLLTLAASDGQSTAVVDSLAETVHFKLKLLEAQDLLALRTLAVHGCGINLDDLRKMNGNLNYEPHHLAHLKLINFSGDKIYFKHQIIKTEILKIIPMEAIKNVNFDIENYYEGPNEKLRGAHLFKANSPQAPSVLLMAIRKELLNHRFDDALNLIENYKSNDFSSQNTVECLLLEGAAYSGLGQFRLAKKSLDQALHLEIEAEQKIPLTLELEKVNYLLSDDDPTSEILEAKTGQVKF